MIHQAAILHKGTVYTLPRPARHQDVQAFIEREEGAYDVFDSEKGFLATWPEGPALPSFLRRRPAMRIAKEAGQILPNRGGGEELYSEDVW